MHLGKDCSLTKMLALSFTEQAIPVCNFYCSAKEAEQAPNIHCSAWQALGPTPGLSFLLKFLPHSLGKRGNVWCSSPFLWSYTALFSLWPLVGAQRWELETSDPIRHPQDTTSAALSALTLGNKGVEPAMDNFHTLHPLLGAGYEILGRKKTFSTVLLA